MANNRNSQIKALIKNLNRETRKSKNKVKEAQCHCPHHSGKGKQYLRQSKKNPNVWICADCGDKLNFGPVANMNQGEMKEYIKDSLKASRNLLNICKIVLNPKEDQKLTKFIGNLQYDLIRAKDVIESALIDNFAKDSGSNKKSKKKNKKGKRGIKITTGTQALFRDM